MKICGIYLLKFYGTHRVYIGQSRDIMHRFTTHTNKMRRGISTPKLNEAFRLFGLPSLEILLECSINELNSAEIEAIGIYNSYDEGFNSIEGGGAYPVLSGESNFNSKYLDEEIESFFLFIVNNLDKSLYWVSDQLGVHRSTLKNINNGYSHRWLKDKYPEEYSILMDNKGKRPINSLKYSGKPIPIAISPEGEEFFVEHISNFAKEHNLNSGALGEVLRGNTTQHKGWYSGGFK